VVYQYGDSSDSPFEINYIDFLRRAVEVLADVVVAERAISALHTERKQHEAAARADEAQLAQIAAGVYELLAPVESATTDTPVSRCAGSVREAAAKQVDAEVSRVRARMAKVASDLASAERRQRERCHERLATLLLDYDLPETRRALALDLREAEPYAVTMVGETSYGAGFALRLDVPDEHAYARPARVQQLAPDLEIHLPETGGWLRKETRMVRHKLGKMFVLHVTVDPDEVDIALRNHAEDDDAGYDVVVHRTERTAAVFEVDRSGTRGARFDAAVGDEPTLCDFADTVADAAEGLCAHRAELVQVTLDEQSIVDDGDLALLVDRVIAAMAPDVVAIAERSLSPTELVLRRRLSGDRREELFVPKAELAASLDKLAADQRARFGALGLPAAARASTSELEPEMIVDVRDQSEPAASRPATSDIATEVAGEVTSADSGWVDDERASSEPVR